MYKMLFKTKLTIMLAIFLVAFPMYANNANGQDLQSAKVQLNLKKASISQIFKQIETQTNFTFVYGEELKTIGKQIGFATSNSLDKVLKQLSQDFGIDFQVINKTISVKINVNNKLERQKRTITGTITDESGIPIPGVSVMVKGTTVGVATDFDGNFSLELPEGVTHLVVSSIGFISQEIAIAGKREFKIVLKEDTEQLDEVVVVGYGVQRKGDVTTAISSVRAKDLEDKPVTSVAEAMVGKMPGVHISQGSGSPGANLQIRVRGIGTITAGSNPLYVVDGVPLGKEDLNTFNSNDIESIQVLKDASSAAIYGSRGSNGVVLITTKKGNEGKASITYSTYMALQNVSKKIDMLNAYQYAELVRDARNNSYFDRMESINKRRQSRGQSPLSYSINDDNAKRLQNTSNSYNTIIPKEIVPYLNGEQGLTDTDWQDEIFRTAVMTNHTISLSGGTANIRYYSSLDYLKQEGIVIGTDFERVGLRLNLDGKSGIFKYGVALNPSFAKESQVNANGAYT